MTWKDRIFGTAAKTRALEDMNALCEAIAEAGDQTDAMQVVLRRPRDLNSPAFASVFPIILAGQGVMIVERNTFPLILAAMLHKPGRSRLLLEHGARVDVTCAHGRTPLHWAVAGEPDSRLLNHHDMVCKEALAAGRGREPMGSISAEHQAASLATTRLLLEHGARPDAADSQGNTALHRACSVGGKAEHMLLLLQRGADVNARTHSGMTPLLLAARAGLPDAVAVLLQAGGDPRQANEHRATPLHWACASRSLPVARQLIAAGADPRARDEDEITPIAMAEHFDDAALLGALLAADATRTLLRGEDGDDPPTSGRMAAPEASSALILATAAGDLAAVRELLSRGDIDLGATTSDGWTALHEAVVHGVEMTRVLLAAGADVNAASDAGYTPLHRAASQGLVEVVRLLVAHGADVSAVDDFGNALPQFARSSRDSQTIALAASLCGNAGEA
jgi:cytohesin